MIDPKSYRHKQLAGLTNEVGVYALCDLDHVPIYVGQSVDGIRSRVRRHLSSARSDVIANRQVDVWEIASVWAWPVSDVKLIPDLEAKLFETFNAERALMNGSVPSSSQMWVGDLPTKQVVQVIAEDERLDRLKPTARLPRQIAQYLSLVDYILTVKDSGHLHRSLNAHFERLVRYHNSFGDNSQ